MGGLLDNSAFTALERRAEYIINAQAGGKTGERIGKLAELPQAVRDCTFDLIRFLNDISSRTVASESQSQGGRSESYSYAVLTKEEADAEVFNLIFIYLYAVKINGVSLLYRGTADEY